MDNTTSIVERESLANQIQQYTMIVIAVIGIAGNCTSAYILLFTKTIRKAASSDILVSQSIVDLVSCVAVFGDMLTAKLVTNARLTGVRGLVICWILIGNFFFHTSITISTYNMLSLTLERAVSVVWPIFHLSSVNRRTIHIMIASSWMIGIFLIASALFPTSRVVEGVCINWAFFPSVTYKRIFGLADIVFTYIIPLTIIATCYATIYAKIYVAKDAPAVVGSSSASSAKCINENHNRRRRNNGMLRTMLTIVTCYVLCNSLRHVVIVAHKFGSDISMDGLLERVGLVFMFSNSAMNPIIYTFQYRDYRRELDRLVRGLTRVLFKMENSLSDSQSKYEHDSRSSTLVNSKLTTL